MLLRAPRAVNIQIERLQKREAMIVLREGSSKDPMSQLGCTNLHVHALINFQVFDRFGTNRTFFTLHSISPINNYYKTRSTELNVVLPAVTTEFRGKNYVPKSKNLQ